MLQKFDERNRNLIININGQLVHRDKAGISPFDSAVQGGDAVWEGLRLYNGRIFKLHEHLSSGAFGPRFVIRRNSPARKNFRGDQTHTRGKQDARRRPYSPHAYPRLEDHVWNGSTSESERTDVDRSGGAQVASLRENRSDFDYKQSPAPAP